MKRITGVCLLFCSILMYADTAIGQGHTFINFDSLKKQLPLQKTAADSIRVLQKMADVSFSLDDIRIFVKDAGYVNSLLELNKRVKIIDPYPYQLIQKATRYQVDKQFVDELEVLKLAVTAFDKQHKDIFPLLIYIRLLYNKMNDQEAKLIYFKQKLEYYQLNGPVANVAGCYHSIGGYYLSQAVYNQAINNYLKAAEIFRKFNPRFYSNEMMVTGNCYGKWGNNEKAVYFVEKLALPIQKRLNDSLRMAFCEEVLGGIYMRDKQYEKAVIKFNQAIGHISAQYINSSYANYLVEKAEVYLKINRADSALLLIKKAKAFADEGGFQIQNTNGNLEIDFALYEYYVYINEPAEAVKNLLQAMRKAEEAKSVELQLKYLKTLGYFYKEQGKTDQAARYFDQYFRLRELNEKDQGKFKVAQYEIDQNDQLQRDHINKLKQEKAVQDYQLSRRNVLLITSLVIVLLISGLLVFIYRQFNINKKTLVSLRTTQRQLVQSEKMASLGELTAGIAHEIQNPLNFVNNFAEVSMELTSEMQQELKAGNTEEAIDIAAYIEQNLEKIRSHGQRADFIVKGMLQHSRTNTGEKQLTDINILADEFLKLSYHGLRAKDKTFNAEMVTDFDPSIPKVSVVQQDMGRVLLNLFNNAFYAVNKKQKTAGANYRPTVSVTTSAQQGQLVIKVKDNGVGIPADIRDKIMQPFFTTKPTGEGTGLGLSLSYDMVVDGHGGKIEVESEEGTFTEFTITIPV